jgi:hypothetical protein
MMELYSLTYMTQKPLSQLSRGSEPLSNSAGGYPCFSIYGLRTASVQTAITLFVIQRWCTIYFFEKWILVIYLDDLLLSVLLQQRNK